MCAMYMYKQVACAISSKLHDPTVCVYVSRGSNATSYSLSYGIVILEKGKELQGVWVQYSRIENSICETGF